jgi:hypothetical protein
VAKLILPVSMLIITKAARKQKSSNTKTPNIYIVLRAVKVKREPANAVLPSPRVI